MSRRRGHHQITPEDAALFDKAQEQLLSFYREIGSISKKKPSEPLNKFKLGFINQTLTKANDILGDEYRPFPDFTTFDIEGTLPTASDVVMMLDQYSQSMIAFKNERSTYGEWNLPRVASTDQDEQEDDEFEGDDENDEIEDEDETD